MKRRETVSHFLELHSTPCESKLNTRDGRGALRQTSLSIRAGSQPQDAGNKALERTPLCFLCEILIKEGAVLST